MIQRVYNSDAQIRFNGQEFECLSRHGVSQRMLPVSSFALDWIETEMLDWLQELFLGHFLTLQFNQSLNLTKFDPANLRSVKAQITTTSLQINESFMMEALAIVVHSILYLDLITTSENKRLVHLYTVSTGKKDSYRADSLSQRDKTALL